jgi:hypothetical protein
MKKEYLSNCCNAKIIVRGKVTHFYVCLKCGKACDVYFDFLKKDNDGNSSKIEY